jgi:B12-binding domain/radical SAM domain protein
MTLRAVAVSCPSMASGALGEGVLKSTDPASLFNACRLAAHAADRGTGYWGESNWATTVSGRRRFLMLMHSLAGDIEAFESLLLAARPNLLLLGAMSVCLPGAVACAQRARDLLGDEVFIVLGGRHVSETIYRDPSGVVRHHAGSPVRLASEGRTSSLFDAVVAGEGEDVIVKIGESVGRASTVHRGFDRGRVDLAELAAARGDWICYRAGHEEPLTSRGIGLPRHALPSPAAKFGVSTYFDVFGGRPTAHVFADIGSGCVFDCEFCSERRSVTGRIREPSGAAVRLFGQLRSAHQQIAGSGRTSSSAFVEDSTLLGGSAAQIAVVSRLLRDAALDLKWGGQFTVDQVLRLADVLPSLVEAGFRYVFLGVETLDPNEVGGMSKDTRSRSAPWRDRTERAIALLADVGVQVGSAVLFGLGERQEHRLALLDWLFGLRDRCGSPAPISLNWATQHPLRGLDGGRNYRYLDWAVPEGEWAEAFSNFGEASVSYPLAGCAPPRLEEVREIEAARAELSRGEPVPA